MPIVTVQIDNYEQWQALRAQNVGASEIGALFGVHDYLTGYALAARKMGKLEDTLDNSVLRRGRYLEPVVRQLLAEQQQDWTQIGAGSYYYDSDIHLGCTPDLFVRIPERGVGIVQIKTVAPNVFASKWRNDAGEIQPPLWIALQAMVEQHLTSAEFAYVAALVIGSHEFELHVIEVPYLPEVIDVARHKTVDFWNMVGRGQLPEPDFGRDAGTLSKVLRQDDGSELDLRGDNEISEIVAQLEAARDAASIADDNIKHCNARLLHKVGSAERAIYSGGVITAKTVHRKGYVAQPSSYRRLTVRHERMRA